MKTWDFPNFPRCSQRLIGRRPARSAGAAVQRLNLQREVAAAAAQPREAVELLIFGHGLGRAEIWGVYYIWLIYIYMVIKYIYIYIYIYKIINHL